MDFLKQKQRTLNWKDQSKKGDWDKQIIPLLETINSFDNFYSTSSCAGRISIIELDNPKRKDKANWTYVSHELSDFDSVKDSLSNFESISKAWFKMESAIIHVCSKTLEDAKWLLNKAKEAGFKHSGILSITDKRIIVEIFGSEKIETIIAKKDHILIDESYLKILVDEANEKLKLTRKKISILKKLLE